MPNTTISNIISGRVFLPDIFIADSMCENHGFQKMINIALKDKGEDFWQKFFKCKDIDRHRHYDSPFVYLFTEMQLHHLWKTLKNESSENNTVKTNLERSREKYFSTPGNRDNEINVCYIKFRNKENDDYDLIKLFLLPDSDELLKEPKCTNFFNKHSFESEPLDLSNLQGREKKAKKLQDLIFTNILKSNIKNLFNDFNTIENNAPGGYNKSGKPWMFYLGDSFDICKKKPFNNIVQFCQNYCKENNITDCSFIEPKLA